MHDVKPRMWRGRWSLKLVAAVLLYFIQGTWQYEAEPQVVKYFEAGADNEVIVDLSAILSLGPNSCTYDVEIVTNSQYAKELALYWNRTAILLKLMQHSSLVNYTNEYTLELIAHYRPNCSISMGFEEPENQRHVKIKLRPLSVHLTSPRELIEGQPLDLTCTVLGHTPKDDSKIKINYWFSGDRIANCSNETTELNFDIINNTCKLSAHSNQSNSGDYSCSASIEDMVVTSENQRLNVEIKQDKQDWKIISIAVGAAVGSILLTATIIVIGVLYKIIKSNCGHLPVQVIVQEENNHLACDRGEDENMPLMHGQAGIRENQGFDFNANEGYGGDDHRRIEASLHRRQDSRAGSDGSQPNHSLYLSDQGGYESNV